MATINYTVFPGDLTEAGVETFSTQDLSVNESFNINSSYDQERHIVELHISDITQTHLFENRNYRGVQMLLNSVNGSNVYLDPIEDIKVNGYEYGDVFTTYNFLERLSNTFYISSISPDRTEVGVTPLSTKETYQDTLEVLRELLGNDSYFDGIRLNFGKNDLFIGLNVGEYNNEMVIKLYEPLPDTYVLKDRFTFDKIISDSVSYFVVGEVQPEKVTFPSLRGPNFNLVEETNTQSTEFMSFEDLYNYPVSRNYYEVSTFLSQSGVEVNIDYLEYENFINFSSAEERLINFKYKLELLENYEHSSSIDSHNKIHFDNLITDITSRFDGYERFLYYQSGSKSWPKTNDTKPYEVETVFSSSQWYNQEIESASLYDENNSNRLRYTLPEFIREDQNNSSHLLFLDMIGQHFDQLWVSAKGLSKRYDADNRLDKGVSKEIVGDLLKSFGTKLYSSNFSSKNLAATLQGEFYQSGSEEINHFITASNEPTPDKDIVQETYKRLYHNLPYLTKTKGTLRGLKSLITTFGVPAEYGLNTGSIYIQEYGGEIQNDEFYSGYTYPISSDLDKIKIDNTGSYIGKTLSPHTSIRKVKDVISQDIHVIDVGISPTDESNRYIEENVKTFYTEPSAYAIPDEGLSAYVMGSGFNVDEHIGDPREGTGNKYKSLQNLNKIVTHGLDRYNLYSVIRLMKFFDLQLFKMIKDFVPGRVNISTGILIKPHVLDRSKIHLPHPIVTQHEYSSSIDMVEVEGTEGNVIPFEESTTHTITLSNKTGSISKVIDDQSPLLNGELGGTELVLSDGNLNRDNYYKKSSIPDIKYNVTKDFLSSTSEINSGEEQEGPPPVEYLVSEGGLEVTYQLVEILGGFSRTALHLNIHKIDANGVDRSDNIRYATKITVAGREFTIENIIEYPNYFFIDIVNVTGLSNGQTVPVGLKGVLLDPFIVEGFYNSDYNVTLNNSEKDRTSSKFYKVDRSRDIIPQNLDSILLRSATYANIQDSSYASKAYTGIRYDGSRLVGQELNKYTPGDTSIGKKPVIELMSHYIAYVESAKTLDPLVANKTQYSAKYLFDSEETVIDTAVTPDAYLFLTHNFPEKSKVRVQVEDPLFQEENNYYLNSVRKVFKSGKRAEYIGGTETVRNVFTSSVDFPAEGNTSNYESKRYESDPQLLIGNTPKLKFSEEEYQGDGHKWNHSPTTGTTYEFTEPSNAQVKFTSTGTITSIEGSTQDAEVTLQIHLQGYGQIAEKEIIIPYNGASGGNSGNQFGGPGPTGGTGLGNQWNTVEFDIESNYRFFANEDKITVQVSSPTGHKLEVGLNATFTAIQTPKHNIKILNSALWQYHPDSLDKIVATPFLMQVYGDRIQALNQGSTMPPATLTYTVEVGDEFRFNGAERYTLVVVDVSKHPVHSRIVVTFNRTIPEDLRYIYDINKFTHRRYVDDSSSIILNQAKNPGITSPIYVSPEYVTPELKGRAGEVVKDLKSKNLI